MDLLIRAIQALLFLLAFSVLRMMYLVVYRLYFHPLASYPGPKLSAATHWVETYHDVYKRGQFIFRLRDWHAQYGPIIRINPDELHIDDHEFYETLYGGPGSKRDKYEPWCRLAGSLGSAFATSGHALHRNRRKLIQPLFSKASITKIEPLIERNVVKLEARLEKAVETGEVIVVSHAFFALIMDIILQYAFDSQELVQGDDELTGRWYTTIHAGFESGTLMRHFPWMFGIVNALPLWAVGMLDQSLKFLLDWRAHARKQVEHILNARQNSQDKLEHRTVFHEMRDSDSPDAEKGVDRLLDEAQVFLGAGSETTSNMMAVTTYYLLSNKDCLRQLQDELIAAGAGSKRLPWTELEQLPFLSAVMSEGLRLSYGATTRLPRVVMDEQLAYNGRVLPRGTPVSMTQYFIMTNEDLFPHADQFQPQRWLNSDGTYNHSMNKLIVNFGRGSRQCVGMNLAYAEMYMTLAMVFSRFHLELFDTTSEDIAFVHDFFVAVPKADSKGVRVRVTAA